MNNQQLHWLLYILAISTVTHITLNTNKSEWCFFLTCYVEILLIFYLIVESFKRKKPKRILMVVSNCRVAHWSTLSQCNMIWLRLLL